MFKLHRLTYRTSLYGFMLDIPELLIDNEGVTAIVGKNGSGKSTLLHLMAGLKAPTRGTCTFEGRACFQAYDTIKAQVQMLSWSIVFDGQLTANDYLRVLKAKPRPWDSDLEAELLSEFYIPTEQKISTLSRGEQAKLKLLLALCQRPKYLLIDELTSELDHESRKAIFRTIDREVFAGKLRVLWATNIIDDVDRFANHLIVLSKGQVTLNTDLESFRRRHQKLLLRYQGAKNMLNFPAELGLQMDWDGKRGILTTNNYREQLVQDLGLLEIAIEPMPYATKDILQTYGA